MGRGRPRKHPVTVTMTQDEALALAKGLGYASERDMLDDLAMGRIRPAESQPKASLEGSEVPEETNLPDSEVNLEKGKGSSWSEQVEQEEKEVAQAVQNPSIGVNPFAVKAQVVSDLKSGAGNSQADVTKNVKTWMDVVKGNRALGSGLSLEFVPPTNVDSVKISQEEWDEGATLWKFPVVGMVVNAKPSYSEVMKWVEVNWKSFAPAITQLKPGVFVFDFSKEDHRLSVLQRNWTFYHKYPMVIKPWDVDKKLDDISLDTTMVWVQLPGLPARLWSSKNLSTVVSFIGTPVATDRMTALRTRLDFARVLVEVKTRVAYPEEILIDGPKGKIVQPVVYEWKMKKCSGCGRLGHEIDQCRNKDIRNSSKEPVNLAPSTVVKESEVPVISSIVANSSVAAASTGAKVIAGSVIQLQPADTIIPKHGGIKEVGSTISVGTSALPKDDGKKMQTFPKDDGIKKQIVHDKSNWDGPTNETISPKGGSTTGNPPPPNG